MIPDRPVVFLDRDGTLIRDYRYNADPSRLDLLPGVASALRILGQAGFSLVVVTNQSGVARGLFTESDATAMGRHLQSTLAKEGVDLDGYYYCPHHLDGVVERFALRCTCRKPAPGLIHRARGELGLTMGRSWMIGDSLSDVLAAKAAGSRGILVDIGSLSRPQLPEGTLIARNFPHAARLALVTDGFIDNCVLDPVAASVLNGTHTADDRSNGTPSAFPSAAHGRQAELDAHVLEDLVSEIRGSKAPDRTGGHTH